MQLRTPSSLARVALLLAAIGCERGIDTLFSQQVEARRLADDMRIELHRSAEAVQRAIMAESDDDARAFVQEAEATSAALEGDLRVIEPIVAALDLPGAAESLREFADAFGGLRGVDRTLYELAVENSNAKAQQIAFGSASEAADAFASALEGAVHAAAPAKAQRAELLAARAQLGVREIQALQAPHIAEAQDDVMAQLEQQMASSEAAARAALAELSALLAPAGGQELEAARAQLDRFSEAQREIVELSRRNTDVRSLAVALGDKRVSTARCDAALAALQDALALDRFRATR